jgi:DNA polymerase III subunit delta'
MTLEQAIDYFRGGVARQRVGQAYLVVAPPNGVGREFAERAMQMLFCEQGPAACGVCRGCRDIAAHRHPDAVWVEPVKRSRILSVDQLRELRSQIYRTSFGGGWKAAALMSADRMKAGAANAFLKTLEEPPPRCLFLLLTDRPEALLSTIVSRCQRVSITDPDAGRLAPEVESALVEILTAIDSRSYLSRAARGDRLVKLVKALADDRLAELDALPASEDEDQDKELVEAREAMVKRGLRHDILRWLAWWYRDTLLLVSGADASLVRFPDRLEALRAIAARTTPRKALRDVADVEVMSRQLERNLPDALVFGRAFAELN